ncbi:MAG: hypothetical protein ACREQ4_04465 [Candidatus Binataceae bacterium]
MSTLNTRVDGETSAFLERLSRQTGRIKPEVVREALAELRVEFHRRPPAVQDNGPFDRVLA